MNLRSLPAAAAAVAAILLAMPVTPSPGTEVSAPIGPPRAGSIPAGTRGVIRTVLSGNRIEEIPLEFLGLYHGAAGPGHDLYLVRLEGDQATRIGVAGGMSGSPVVVDGRVVGALSYRIGNFPKEPIAGVTPIEDLLGAARIALPATTTPDTRLAPIGAPVFLGGVSSPVRGLLAERLESLGLTAVPGGAEDPAAVTRATATPLVPGSVIGVGLVRGDLTIAAVGTVAWVDGPAIFAFGHPFLGTGRVEMPLLGAEVVHTLASLSGSVKLSNVGGEIGSVVEDRLTGVVGMLGQRARMLPITLSVEGGDYPQKVFHFEVVRQMELAPLLAGAAVANALFLNLGYDDEATVRTSGRVSLRGLPDVPLATAATSGASQHPVIAASAEIQRVLDLIYRNPFRAPEVEAIELTVRVRRERVRYTFDSVRLDRRPVHPGDTLHLRAVLRSFRGQTIERPLEIVVPEGLPPGGTLTLAVGDARSVARTTGRSAEARLRSARDMDAYVRALGSHEPTHRLVAALVHPSGGAVAAGSIHEDLPPTAAHLLASAAGGSGAVAQRTATLARVEEELDGPLEGGAVVRLQVAR